MERRDRPDQRMAERRRRQLAAGGRPRVTEEMKRRYLRLVATGVPVAVAAEQSGFSASYATKLNKKHRPQIQRMKAPPDPIPNAELSQDAMHAIRPNPTGFEFMCRRFLGLEYSAWHGELAMELLEAYYSDEDEYIVLNVHPGSGKSTVVTYAFPIYVICRERSLGQEPRIHLGHKAEKKAKWYLSRLAGTFVNNFDLIQSFGRFRPERRGPGVPWSATELMIEPMDWTARQNKEPTLSIGSYDGSELTGRYDILLWDDLLDHDNQSTVDQRETVVDRWEQEFETRMDPGGLVVLSNARYGPEDLSSHLLHQRLIDPDDLEPEERPVYRRIIFPVHDASKCHRTSDGRTEHHGDYPEGCLLDAKRLTKTRPPDPRAAWRRVLKAMKNDRRYRLVWQQENVEPTGALAHATWFTGGTDHQGFEREGCFDYDRSFGQLPQREDARSPRISAICVDPAASNFWAVSHFLVYEGDLQVILQGFRNPLKAPELLYREQDGRYTGKLEDFWQLAAKLGVPPRYVIVETRAQQRYLKQYPFVREWAQARGVTMTDHDTNRVNKADSDYGVEINGPIYREGRLRIPYQGYEERLYAEAFKREATSWPDGATTDLVMHHWFLTFRLPQLQAIRAAASEPEVDEDVPNWAAEMMKPRKGSDDVPNWVGELVGA